MMTNKFTDVNSESEGIRGCKDEEERKGDGGWEYRFAIRSRKVPAK